MFYRPAHEYIIDYKPMSHIQTLVGLYIDLFTHIYIKRIYNAVKYFNTNRCAIDFIASSLDFFQKWINKNHLFIIYNSPRSQDLVMYLYSKDAHNL